MTDTTTRPGRQWIIDLIRDQFDPCPDLGAASYKAFEDSWNDGAEAIADAILAQLPLLNAERERLQATAPAVETGL